MLALLLVSGFLGRLVLAGLELELLLPRYVAARAPTDALLRLRNVKRMTPSFSIELSGRRNPLNGAEPILRNPIYFSIVNGRSQAEVPVKLTFPWRGHHRENLFVLSTRFPFGFLHREVPLPVARETLVFPAIEENYRSHQLLAQLEGETAAQQRGRGHEFYRIRPWESSDGTRMVDWKSTAHTGELQAREFAREEQSAVQVIFDRCIPPGTEQRFESLVEECAWIVWTLSDRAVPFEFRCEEKAGSDVYSALRFLATVQPSVGSGPLSPAPPSDEAGVSRIFLSLWS